MPFDSFRSAAVLVALLSLFPSLLMAEPFSVTPDAVSLKGNFAQTQLVVTAVVSDRPAGYAEDFTPRATFASSNDAIVTEIGRAHV